MNLSKNETLAMLVLILLMASVFYLFRLGAVSFWEDETWLVIGMSGSPADLWTHAAQWGVHPPLYFYLAYLVKPFIGTSEFALRWLSGLCALIGIAWTYRLTVDLTNRQTGVYAAFLASGSLLLIYLARLARHYTLFYALCSMSMWAYVRYRQTSQRQYALLLAVGFAAALWTHYFSAFIGLTIALHSLLTLPRRQIVVIWGALFVGSLLFSPWLPAIYTQLNAEHGEGLYYGVFTIPAILDNFIGHLSNAHWIFSLGFSLCATVALYREKQRDLALLIFLWVVVSFILIISVNQTLFVWYIGRNMLYTLPALTLFYGYGLRYLSQWRIGRLIAILSVTSYVIYGLLAFTAFWHGTIDWRGAMQRLVNDARPTDTYVVNGEPYSTDYYLTRFLGERPQIQRMSAWLANPQASQRIWLIDTHQNMANELHESLPETMQLTRWLEHEPLIIEFWQQAPTQSQVIFGEQLALGYVDATPLIAQTGETLLVDVWWQAVRTPDFNYSAGFKLLNSEGVVIAEQDGNFGNGRIDAQVLPVGEWSADTRRLLIPANTPSGTYTLYVTVYDWRDSTRLAASPEAEMDLFPLLEITIP